MIRAEFHVHTRYSKDSILNKYFILMMCKIKKIKLIAITDHNEVAGALKYSAFLKKHNIDVIVGEEIMTDSGEIIGLYLNKKIESNLSVKETIKLIREQNGLVYLPHPYDEKRSKTVLKSEEQMNNKASFDFIEIHNGRNIKKEFSDKQELIQKNIGATRIIGSDAHTFFELGRNYILMDYDGKDNLKTNIENGQIHKSNCIKYAHFCTKIARIITMIEKGDVNGIYRIIIRKCKRKK